MSRSSNFGTVACFLIFSWCLLAARQSLSVERPNVLFLFADDFTYEAIAALGHTDIETPNLDRLVKRGTTFTHAYNMGGWNGAICVASRNMLLTGRSLWRAEQISKSTQEECKAGRLWPQLLKNVGYDTYMTGKWHIQAKPELTFDVVRHVRPGMPDTVPASYDRPAPGKSDDWSASDTSLGGFWNGGKHWSEVGADDAIDFIEMAKSSLRDEKLAPFPRTEYSIQIHRREYYSLITHLDQQIGRILDSLEKSGLADNTYVFFTADHGLAVGNHGLVGKQNMYDHSIRVPFLVTGPQVKRDHRISAPIYLQDVMATTLELASVPKPSTTDFRSFLPLLRGETDRSHYDAIYGAYLQLQRCVVMDQWKLIVYPAAGVTRLYNLNNDPLELKDVASDPANTDRKKVLFQKLLTLQSEFGDKMSLKP